MYKDKKKTCLFVGKTIKYNLKMEQKKNQNPRFHRINSFVAFFYTHAAREKGKNGCNKQITVEKQETEKSLCVCFFFLFSVRSLACPPLWVITNASHIKCIWMLWVNVYFVQCASQHVRDEMPRNNCSAAMQAKNLLYTHIRFWICIMEKLAKIKDYVREKVR